MIRIERETFKIDPVFKQIYERVKKYHKVAKHTENDLRRNKHIPDFCQEATHFVEMVNANRESLYLHYEVGSWWKEPNGVVVKIDAIIFYENKDEYEAARRKGLNSTADADDVARN